jgi:putative endonuclease
MKSKKQKSYNLGLYAEIFAMIFLTLKFYKILAWRYKTKFGEIDIIAKRGKEIAFIEVKARKNLETQELVTSNQQSRITDAAKIFLTKNSKFSQHIILFNLIIVKFPFTLKYIKNAW